MDTPVTKTPINFKQYATTAAYIIAVLAIVYAGYKITSAFKAPPTPPTKLEVLAQELTASKDNMSKKEDAAKLAIYEACKARDDVRLKSFAYAAAGGVVEDYEGMKQRFAAETCVDPFQQPVQPQQ